jgi:hypothetical protein
MVRSHLGNAGKSTSHFGTLVLVLVVAKIAHIPHIGTCSKGIYVPRVRKEHIANIEQIVYSLPIANCSGCSGRGGQDQGVDASVASESRP